MPTKDFLPTEHFDDHSQMFQKFIVSTLNSRLSEVHLNVQLAKDEKK